MNLSGARGAQADDDWETAQFVGGSIGPDFVGVTRQDIASVEVDGEIVLYDGERRRIHRLNHTASTIWGCLDGQTSLQEIAGEAAVTYSVDQAVILRDLMAVTRRLANEGLIVDATTGRVTREP